MQFQLKNFDNFMKRKNTNYRYKMLGN